MKIFSFFRKTNPSGNPHEPIATQAITGDSTTENALKEEPSVKMISITYGTGMPIDIIYAFVNHDYEQEGYQDALVNPDAGYCTAKESMIQNQLQQLFRRILLRYRDEIRGIDVQIANAKSLFALTSASMLEARKETCEEHIAEINQMIEKSNAKSPEMMTMIESYRRGFTKGCAAQTANFLNPTHVNG